MRAHHANHSPTLILHISSLNRAVEPFWPWRIPIIWQTYARKRNQISIANLHQDARMLSGKKSLPESGHTHRTQKPIMMCYACVRVCICVTEHFGSNPNPFSHPKTAVAKQQYKHRYVRIREGCGAFCGYTLLLTTADVESYKSTINSNAQTQPTHSTLIQWRRKSFGYSAGHSSSIPRSQPDIPKYKHRTYDVHDDIRPTFHKHIPLGPP